jgi:hypothetical protein
MSLRGIGDILDKHAVSSHRFIKVSKSAFLIKRHDQEGVGDRSAKDANIDRGGKQPCA